VPIFIVQIKLPGSLFCSTDKHGIFSTSESGSSRGQVSRQDSTRGTFLWEKKGGINRQTFIPRI